MGVETVYDRLVRGTVDLHCHIDLEFSETKFRKISSEWEWLPHAEDDGARAFILKSHLWPTMQAIPYVRELYRGPVEVFGSITLNTFSGGLDPWAVEVAAALGARAVFMPTWSSVNDASRHGFGRRLELEFEHFDHARMGRLTVLDEDERLTDAAREVIRLTAEKDMMLSTGHLGWKETLEIVREAHAIGYDRVLCGHPLSNSVGATHEAILEAASLGGSIEFCWPTIAPGRHAPGEVVGLIGEIGAERAVITSDFFGGSDPEPSRLMRVILGALYNAGLTEDEIDLAAKKNPAALAGLD